MGGILIICAKREGDAPKGGRTAPGGPGCVLSAVHGDVQTG